MKTNEFFIIFFDIFILSTVVKMTNNAFMYVGTVIYEESSRNIELCLLIYDLE